MPAPMSTLIIATRNRHKVEEIRGILGDTFRFLTLNDFPDAPTVVEDANTFAGNATKKAVALARWIESRNVTLKSAWLDASSYVLADDSGLEVDALNGAPGVRSARFAALDTGVSGNSSDAENNAKLLRLLKAVPLGQRTARFRCTIALTPVLEPHIQSASPVCAADEHELQTEIFEGACEGQIAFTAAGQGGFGYDPLFIPRGQSRSFAELDEDLKNRISHRAKALAKLRSHWIAKLR